MKLVSQKKKITYGEGGLLWELNLVYEFAPFDRRYVDFVIDACWSDEDDFPTGLYPECVTNFKTREAIWDWDVDCFGAFVACAKRNPKTADRDVIIEENKAMNSAVKLFKRYFKTEDLCK